jgi:hypothetical protein
MPLQRFRKMGEGGQKRRKDEIEKKEGKPGKTEKKERFLLLL